MALVFRLVRVPDSRPEDEVVLHEANVKDLLAKGYSHYRPTGRLRRLKRRRGEKYLNELAELVEAYKAEESVRV